MKFKDRQYIFPTWWKHMTLIQSNVKNTIIMFQF